MVPNIYSRAELETLSSRSLIDHILVLQAEKVTKTNDIQSVLTQRISLQFVDPNLENLYVSSCVEPRLAYVRRVTAFCAFLYAAVVLSGQKSLVPILNDGFTDEMDQGKIVVFISGLVFMSSAVAGLLPWRCQVSESLTTAWVGLSLVVAITHSRWFSTRMVGEDPWEVWGEPADHCFNTTSSVLNLDAIISIVSLLFPIRFSRLWPVMVLSSLLYFCFCTLVGSPNSAGGQTIVGQLHYYDLQDSVMLALLSFVALLGRRRIEQEERSQFAQVRGLTAKVSHLNENVDQLKAYISALQALMSTVCEVVFKTDSDLRVVGDCQNLEDLLGPMEGRRLVERLSDSTQVERFTSILRPFLHRSVGSSDTGLATVLVPPVQFAVPEGSVAASQGFMAFEAEILVADTQSICSSSHDEWRFLVGLKALTRTAPSSVPMSLQESGSQQTIRLMGLEKAGRDAAQGRKEHQPLMEMCSADRGKSIRKAMSSSSSSRTRQREVKSLPDFDRRSELSSCRTIAESDVWPSWAKSKPEEMLDFEVLEMLERLPISEGDVSCCRWHQACNQIEHAMRRLQGKFQECKSMWFPHFGWQCQNCFSLQTVPEEDGGDEEFFECIHCSELTKRNVALCTVIQL